MSLAKKIEEKRKAKERARKIETVKNVGIGVATGVVAGAVGGVLLAPKSGKETREDIKEAGAKVTEKVGSTVKETYRLIGDKVVIKREQIDESKEKIKDYIESKKHKNADVVVEESEEVTE